jgi:hypothetical protein
MTAIPLRLGPLAPPGYEVRRSGLRWLCDEGHVCRPREVVAFCNVALAPATGAGLDSGPFADEARDFQIGFAPRVGGRLTKAAASSQGGFLDQHHNEHRWRPDFIIGHLEREREGLAPDDDADGELHLLHCAGRRMTEIAEIRSGLLSGWHDRSRAWWGEGDGAFGTLLSVGICELIGVIRGENLAFLEMFEAVPGPAQAIHIADEPLVPCAMVATEQCLRTPDQFQAIAADFARTFPAGPVAPTPADWIFAGSMLSALQRSPLTEHYDILTRIALRRTGPADAVILSLNAEPGPLLRHKSLGYAIKCYGFRVAEAGPAVRAWFQTQFEPLRPSLDDILRDYRRLISTVRARSDVKFLILNAMSTSASDDVHCYAMFERPLGNTLASIRAKELNLMLHDLAREEDVAIVDLDAIGAELGTRAHIPDGVHHSGPMQTEVRAEILRILRAFGIPGFGSR